MNKNQKMRKVLSILCVMVMLVAMMVVGSVVAFAEESNSVARVGENEYTSLKAAINAANTMDNANVVLLKDVTLSEKLTIKKNMTISGEHTITRGANVTLFAVDKNVTLTLDGGVVIDGGNNWTFDSESYYADLAADKKHENVSSVTYATSAEGGIVAGTQLIYLNATGATVVMNKATIQNIYASNHNNGAAFRVPSGGTLIFNDGALVQHIKGSIAGQTSGGTWIINGGEITGVHAHNTNGGMADMRGASKLIINGGEIHHNTILGLNANGSGVIAMVLGAQAKATINDGYFHHNDSYCPGNGWGAVFYLHSGSTFEMNGGTIEENSSARNTALISNNSGATVSLNAGTIVIDPNNGPYAFDTQIWGTVTIKDGMKLVGEGAATFYTRLENNSTVECDIRLQGATVTGSGTFTGDVYVAANSTISGGTWNGNFTVAEGVTLTITDGIFATDVSAYLAEDKMLVQLEDGTYGVAVNPAYGKEAEVNGEYYETLKEALAAANATEGGATVTLLDDVTYTDEYLVISNVITLDLNGKTITCNGQSGLQVSGTLTLLDSSDAQTGKIIQIGDTFDTSAITLAGGNLIVKSGYIYSDHKGILLGGSNKTNTLKIEGGKIEGANVAVNFNRGYNTVEITGGELLSAKNAFHVASSKVNSVKLTIEDGVFVGAFLDIPDYAEVSILKGIFTVDVSEYLADGRCIKNVDNTYVVDTHDYVAGEVVAPTFDEEGYTVYTCSVCGATENRDPVAKLVVVAEVDGVRYDSFWAALEAAKNSESKVVTVYQTVVIDEDMEVDLGDVRVNAANTIKNAPVFRILANVTFTNGNGIVDARGPVAGEGGINCYAFIVGNSTTSGTLTIKGGTYRGVTSAISITNGVVNISGGTFQTGHDEEGTDYGATYLLNCLDSAYKNGTAVYNITGGKFVGFNPENNAAEGAGTNFLTGNYKASDYYNDGKWYVAEANVAVVIDGKDDVKYFADIYAALNVIQPREPATIKFLADYTFTADQRMFSNYSVVINARYITLDLNGKTLTFDYEGSTSTCYAAFAIYNGGSLTITDTSAEKNGTIYNKSKIQGKDGPRIVWVTSAGTCTILAGNFISEQGDTMFYTSNSNKEIPTCLYIKGGYFEHTIPTSGNEYRYFNQQNGYQKQIIEISGGIFKHNPTDSEMKFADGYVLVENEDGTFGTQYAPVAQVGDKVYTSLQAAINACKNGETVKVLADLTFTEDDVVLAHGGATGFGAWDKYNPTIFYVGGTKGENGADNKPSEVNVVIDLNGKVLTNEADSYFFLIMDNAKVTFTDSVGGGALVAEQNAPVVWVVGTETLVTIEGGYYETASATGVMHSTHGGDLVINGGEFKTTADDASLLLMLNTQDRQNSANFIKGAATITVKGGTFHGFNPQRIGDDYGATSIEDIKFVNGCAEGYMPVANENGSYAVVVDPAYGKVAMVNGEYYETLKEAIAAANATEGGATVTLIDDVTLGEKLVISGNVTICGAYTITRADNYTGTLFEIKSGATLTLDGGLVIDGGNAYVFDKEAYMVDAENRNKISKEDSAKWFTPEAGAPVATAYMFTTTGGTINFNNVTVQNNYSVNSGVVSAGANSTITFTGTKITHVAATQASGVVANVSGANINVVVNEGTVIDGNHVGGNHGIFKVYSGATLTLNGGEITNNTGWNSNGVVIGIYWGYVYMNGGLICSNTGVYGPSNGRNAAIYGHSGHTFVMKGGTICHNAGGYGGLDAPYDNGKTEIYGGAIVDNVSLSGNKYPDILGNSAMKIYGGTFTQDVSQWLAPGFVLEYDEATGTYGTKERYIKSHNLLLGNTIGIYFNVDMDMFGNEVTKNNLTLVVYNEAGKKVAEIEYIEWKNGKVLFNGLAAKQMSDKFYAQVFYNGEALSEESPLVSVKDYANAILKGEYDESTKNLVKALLNYGAQAQGSMGDNTDDLANDILDDADKVVVAPNVSDESVGDAHYYGGSLNAVSNVQFNFKFFANGLDEKGYAIVYFTDAEGNLVPMTTELKLVKDEKKNLLVVTYDALTIEDANLLLTCVVYDAQGNEVAKATDSIASYCARAIAGLTAMKESDKLNETTKYDDQKFKLEFYYAVMNYANAVADYSKGNK